MKKILYTTVIFGLSVSGLVSCGDMLNLTPKSSITQNSMWKDAGDAKAALTGAFNRFRTAFQENYIVWGDYRCGFYGDGIAAGSAERGTIWRNQITPSDIGTNWESLYKAINDCNLIIKHVPDIQFDDAEKKHILASALFLRAYMYYNIGRIWGDAPLLLDGFESDDQEGLYPFRDPVEEIFSHIEQDLNNASAMVGQDESAPLGVTQEAIAMLQTDFYLWEAKVNGKTDAVDKADETVKKVIGSMELSENYEDVFRNDMDPERIFSIAFVEAENVTSFTNDFLINVTNVAESEFVNNPIQVGSTAQWVTLTDEHTAFIRGTDYDSRSDVNISEFTTPQGRSYRWINKYLGTWKGGTRIFDSDLPIYRYAEAVLFKAEIEICRHNFTEALTYINQIAKRAYGIDDYYSGTYSQTEIETILLDERLKEFATEGKAWFDLIRFGQVFSRVESLHGRENEENILLWPVNNESINTNPNIKQTPGYD